jgi:U3 small nucleolar ribonucleoprotein protein IMP4
MAMVGAKEIEARKTQDDEYQMSGYADPKVFLTTSNDPSSRLGTFAKEMKLIIPNCTRVNRGGLGIKELVDLCRANDVTDMIILHETRGEPDGMIVSHLPYGPTAYFALYNTVLRHDINPKKTMKLAYPHLIFHNFGTPLGERVATILKNVFPPASNDEPSGRAITLYNENDFISFRHHRTQKTDFKTIDLEEMGPRFEMRLFRIRLGGLDQTEAKVEWELRPYMNSNKRRKFIGTE